MIIKFYIREYRLRLHCGNKQSPNTNTLKQQSIFFPVMKYLPCVLSESSSHSHSKTQADKGTPCAQHVASGFTPKEKEGIWIACIFSSIFFSKKKKSDICHVHHSPFARVNQLAPPESIVKCSCLHAWKKGQLVMFNIPRTQDVWL